MGDWKTLLARAVQADGCAAVARELGVSRTAISLLHAGKYPGNEKYMAKRILDCLGKVICPHSGQEIMRSQCAQSCAGEAPTCSPAALRHWLAGQKCQHKPVEGENHAE